YNRLSLMRCPVCRREFEKGDSPALPFCSERCRTIDLGRWLGESYGLPVVPDPEADETPDSLDASQDEGTSSGKWEMSSRGTTFGMKVVQSAMRGASTYLAPAL